MRYITLTPSFHNSSAVESRSVKPFVPGSNPGCGVWGISSFGRAGSLQGQGDRFKSGILHKTYKYQKKYENIMENIRIRCKSCNKELEGLSAKTIFCGCPNMATIVNNTKITALDLNQVVMLNSPNGKIKNTVLTNEDIAWQEARRRRKVKRLDFEVR